MPGLYLHIPFCKSRCLYCDFYSTTHSGLQQEYVQALCRELELRQDELQGQPLHTIYLGGGTPSQLTLPQLEELFDTIYRLYPTGEVEEVTLEVNPDDITLPYAQTLKQLPINRISMGIQTFHDPLLKLLNRRHTSAQALQSIDTLRQAGFCNLSIDLMYGLPGQTDEMWQQDLAQATALQAEHLSAYHLTYEEGTPLYRLLQAGQVQEADEDTSIRLFNRLCDTLSAAGYQHYEISNFCLPGRHSRHNSSYWQGIPYLGCGAAAHSYNGSDRRSWNTASLTGYIAAIRQGRLPQEIEVLDAETRYNEWVMTRLRTRNGIYLPALEQAFGSTFLNECLRQARPYLKEQKLELTDQYLRLTREGILTSDSIICNLMYVH